MSLIVALPKESRSQERRVGLDPACVERLLRSDIEVHIETSCGRFAGFSDDDYGRVTVCQNFAQTVRRADIVVKVLCPTHDEIAALPPGCILVCMLSAFQHLQEVETVRDKKITLLAMDLMPRVTRAQPMDAVSSQATVAGYKAALLAAELSPRLFPMLTTAAGTIRPSRVLVLGAGVAGLQAIATARRLGAQVEAYDIRRAAKEQIESLGARMVDIGLEIEGIGGFARALRKDEKQKQHDALAEYVATAHVVICAASIPGRSAPVIITRDMVDRMMPESVIVDLAAPTGGNCELTRIGERYYHKDILIAGPLNLLSQGAVHASEMYARNVYNLLELIVQHYQIVLDQHDDIIARCVVCHDGAINHGPTASLLACTHVPFAGMTHYTPEFPDDNAGWLDEQGPPADVLEAQATVVVQTDSNVQGHGSHQSLQPSDNASFNDSAASSGAAFALAERESMVVMPAPSETHSQEVCIDRGAELAGMDDSDVAETQFQEPTDPLTEIDGIGPALQERLYAFGYRRFKDLATLDADGIRQLATQLELGDKVEEQDWAGQARRLIEVSD